MLFSEFTPLLTSTICNILHDFQVYGVILCQNVKQIIYLLNKENMPFSVRGIPFGVKYEVGFHIDSTPPTSHGGLPAMPMSLRLHPHPRRHSPLQPPLPPRASRAPAP